MRSRRSRGVLVVHRWNLFTYGTVTMHKNIGVIQSTSNETRFGRDCGLFSLFKLQSLPLPPGRGPREFGHDVKSERKPTLRHNMILVFVLRKDDVQTMEWLAVVGGTLTTIQLTDTPYRLVDDPLGSSKT